VILWVLARVLCLAALGAGVAYSASLGFQLNGNCVAGSCPAQPLGFSSNASLPVSSTVTLSNGDMYSLTGATTASNDSNGQDIVGDYQFEVTYLGGAKGGASQADTVTVDLFVAYQTTFSVVNFGAALSGTFGPTLASSSSVKECTIGLCTSSVSPPGAFSQILPISLNASGGAYSFDFTYISQFGAGSPVGSFILFSFPPVPTTPSILIGGIVNAASYAVANGNGAPVAPGALVAIFTSAFSATPATFTTASLPSSLSGVSVTFNGVTAPIVAVAPVGSSPYVSAQVPFEALASGQTSASVPVVLTVNGTPSAPVQEQIVSSQPGIFTIPPTGQGNGILVFRDPTDNVVKIAAPTSANIGYPTAPIPPGTSAFFYATGLGAMTPAVTDGSGTCPASNGECTANSMPTVLIGGVPAQVGFAGQAPEFPGVFQINVTIPQSAPAGNSVPLVMIAPGGSVISNSATVAIQ
jgi:uncharacterized protein (TIGR03437 family)